MKRILVPTDFSDCATDATDVAIYLAKKSHSEIHFIHLVRTPVDWKNLRIEKEKNFPETLHEIGHSKAMLLELRQNAKKAGLKVQTNLIYDNGEIIDQLKQFEYDFIVMGSHGTSGLNDLIGSNSQLVIRHSTTPVLVVKNKPPKMEFKNIVFASSFEEDLRQPFKKILEFSILLKAKIHLLYVNVPNQFMETDEVEDKMSKFLKLCPKETCSVNIYNSLNEEKGIEKFTKKINADLIAIITHGKTGLVQMISPSLAESLVNHSSNPVLSVNLNLK